MRMHGTTPLQRRPMRRLTRVFKRNLSRRFTMNGAIDEMRSLCLCEAVPRSTPAQWCAAIYMASAALPAYDCRKK